MGLPTLKKFLCCISLETGGLIVGWIHLILGAILVFLSITILSLAIFGHGTDTSEQGWVGGYIATLLFASIFLIYYLIVFFAALFLIQGVKRRDHSKMVLFMILMAIGVILQFLQIIAQGWATFFSGLFMACVSAYFFLCIYSLYVKLKSGSMGQPYGV